MDRFNAPVINPEMMLQPGADIRDSGGIFGNELKEGEDQLLFEL